MAGYGRTRRKRVGGGHESRGSWVVPRELKIDGNRPSAAGDTVISVISIDHSRENENQWILRASRRESRLAFRGAYKLALETLPSARCSVSRFVDLRGDELRDTRLVSPKENRGNTSIAGDNDLTREMEKLALQRGSETSCPAGRRKVVSRMDQSALAQIRMRD